MVNSSSSGVGQAIFELESQAGVTHLLGSIRASDLSTDQKNELRDLVFLYMNGGRDTSVKIALTQKIDTYKLQPLPAKKTVPEQALPEQPTIGTFRAAPSFSAPTHTPTPVVEKKEEVISVPEIKVAVNPAPVAPAKEPEVVATPIAIKKEPVPEPQVVPEPPTPTPSPLLSMDDQGNYVERIKEIKSAVNQAVGNPVNLVEMNNEVGREYMNALLDAMKTLNTGSSPVAAMARLETSFVSVQETLKGKSDKVAPVPEPVTRVEPTPVPMPTPVVEQKPEPVVVPVAPLAPKAEPVNVPPAAAQVEIPVTPTEAGTPSISSTWQSSNEMVAKEAAEAASPLPTKLASLADLNPPHHAGSTVPISSSLKTPPQSIPEMSDTNPLKSSEIDEGLNQLLQEWPIFNKSGLFGTGPKGREHPLFKKVANLQIPLLLAGRFEGATQEIKQSITDYMNGWRYEQGLIYEQGETFEHYLRRVIKHILDMQKNK